MATSRGRSDALALGRPVAIDLFSGAGGLSYGLGQAGFDVRLGLDNDKHALATYAENHSGAALLADVREINGRDLMAEAGVSHVDLLAGGPSCQGFSTHGKRLADDPRNFLYKEFMRLVDDIRPSTVLIENVKGMLIAGKGAFRREVEAGFADMGYTVNARVLLAADYGVPQLRERVVFLASRIGDDLSLPAATFGKVPASGELEVGLRPHRTVDHAFSDLPRIGDDHRLQPSAYRTRPKNDFQKEMRDGGSKVWNHVSRPLSPLARSVIQHLGPGQGLRALPPDKLPERFQKMRRIANGELRRDCTTLYHRLSPEKPSYTITCYFTNVSAGAFTHPYEDRAITAREAARLQSFPDSFKFVGSSIPRQIGNAVPPLLAKAVGTSVLDHLTRHGEVAA
jgi:DNA (cytosine-5)-methyltransferase 1